MNRANKVLMGVIFGPAVVYAAICLLGALMNSASIGGVDEPSAIFCIFDPAHLIKGHEGDMFYNIFEKNNFILDLTSDVYDKIWDMLGFKSDEQQIMVILLSSMGFIISATGCFLKPTLDMKGKKGDGQQYLFTTQPLSFLKCFAVPWNIYVSAWRAKYVPVVIPILCTVFIWPYALTMSILMIIVFVFVKIIMSARIKSANRKDLEDYTANTEYAICPKCKRDFFQPKIKCKCGEVFEYPVPDIHGIDVHLCNKNHPIPSINRNDARAKLDSVCPYCEADIQTREAKPIVISMVGAVGSGKTSMMLAGVDGLTDIFKVRGLNVDVVSPGISDKARRGRSSVLPTETGELDSQCMFVRSKNLHGKELVFNDISGREFEPDHEKILFQEYYRYTDGIIFTIDPAAVMAVYNSQSLTKGTKITPMVTFETFFRMYIEINGYSPSVRSTVPFAVVLTKMDNPRVGTAVSGAGTAEKFLTKYGQEQFVKMVRSSFDTVRFFEVSSLSKDTESATEPLKWIIAENDRDLKKLI